MKKTDGSLNHPLWAEEFSVHGAEDKYVFRRQFTKFLVLTSFGMFVGNVWIFVKSLFAKAPCRASGSVGRDRLGDSGRRSETVPLSDGKRSLYSCTDAEQELVAYSQKCTHLSCAVYYSPGKNRLECPCHEGYFSIDTGRVLQGPPPRPLPKIHLEQRGDQVFAIGMEAQEYGEGA